MGGAIHRLTVHPIESADGLSGGLWSSARLAPHNVLRQNAIFSERFRPTDHRCIQNHIPAIFHRLIRCTTLSHSLSLSLSLGHRRILAVFSTALCHRSVFILQRVRQVSVVSENCRRRNINRRPGRRSFSPARSGGRTRPSPHGQARWPTVAYDVWRARAWILPQFPVVTRNNSGALKEAGPIHQDTRVFWRSTGLDS